VSQANITNPSNASSVNSSHSSPSSSYGTSGSPQTTLDPTELHPFDRLELSDVLHFKGVSCAAKGSPTKLKFPKLPLSPDHRLSVQVGPNETSWIQTLGMLCPLFTTYPKSDLRYWGIPPRIASRYETEGKVKGLYPWQIECLTGTDETNQILRGGNLVYVAPTGGGKSLVADILLLRNIYSTGRKGLYIVPYVSMVREKTALFNRILDTPEFNTKITTLAVFGESSGGVGHGVSSAIYGKDQIIVCTLEKAHSIVNALIAMAGARTRRKLRADTVTEPKARCIRRHRSIVRDGVVTVVREVLDQAWMANAETSPRSEDWVYEEPLEERDLCKCTGKAKIPADEWGTICELESPGSPSLPLNKRQILDEMAMLCDASWVDVIVSRLGCVVIDEAHLATESHRGPLLETLLAKLRYISHLYALRTSSKYRKQWCGFDFAQFFKLPTFEDTTSLILSPFSQSESCYSDTEQASDSWIHIITSIQRVQDHAKRFMMDQCHSGLSLPLSDIPVPPIQVIAMSATLGNPALFASSLNAHLYVTTYRPLTLKRYLKLGPYILHPGPAEDSPLGGFSRSSRVDITRRMLTHFFAQPALAWVAHDTTERYKLAPNEWPQHWRTRHLSYSSILDSASYLSHALPQALIDWYGSYLACCEAGGDPAGETGTESNNNPVAKLLDLLGSTLLKWMTKSRFGGYIPRSPGRAGSPRIENEAELSIPSIRDLDLDNVGLLVLDSMTSGGSVLVFCRSKLECEQAASRASRAIRALRKMRAKLIAEVLMTLSPYFISPTHHDERLREIHQLTQSLMQESIADEHLLSQRANVIKTMEGASTLGLICTPPDDSLDMQEPERWVLEGLYVDHTGVPPPVQKIVRAALAQGSSGPNQPPVIGSLFATTTLATGVNLPVTRVIVYGTRVGAEKLGANYFQQMIGRSGRAGHSALAFGESILIVPDRGRMWDAKTRSATANTKCNSPPRPGATVSMGDQGSAPLGFDLEVPRPLASFRVDQIARGLSASRYLERLFQTQSCDVTTVELCCQEARALSLTMPGGTHIAPDAWQHDLADAVGLILSNVEALEPKLVDTEALRLTRNNNLTTEQRSLLYAQVAIERALMDVIALGVCQSLFDIRLFFECTLSAHHSVTLKAGLLQAVDDTFAWLVSNQFIALLPVPQNACTWCGLRSAHSEEMLPQPGSQTSWISPSVQTNVSILRSALCRCIIVPRKLGMTAVSSGLSPREAIYALSVIHQLEQRGLVLVSDLHACSLFLPLSLLLCGQPRWRDLFDWLMRPDDLSGSDRGDYIVPQRTKLFVAKTLGVDLNLLERRAMASVGPAGGPASGPSLVGVKVVSSLALPHSIDLSGNDQAKTYTTAHLARMKQVFGNYNPKFAFHIATNAFALRTHCARSHSSMNGWRGHDSSLTNFAIQLASRVGLGHFVSEVQEGQAKQLNGLLQSIIPAEVTRAIASVQDSLQNVEADLALHRLWFGAQLESVISARESGLGLADFAAEDGGGRDNPMGTGVGSSHGKTTDSALGAVSGITLTQQAAAFARSLGVFAADLGYTSLSLLCLSYAETFAANVPSHYLPLYQLVKFSSTPEDVASGDEELARRSGFDERLELVQIHECMQFLERSTTPNSSLAPLPPPEGLKPYVKELRLSEVFAKALHRNGLADAPAIAAAGPLTVLTVLMQYKASTTPSNSQPSSQPSSPTKSSLNAPDCFLSSTTTPTDSKPKRLVGKALYGIRQVQGRDNSPSKKLQEASAQLQAALVADSTAVHAMRLKECGGGLYARRLARTANPTAPIMQPGPDKNQLSISGERLVTHSIKMQQSLFSKPHVTASLGKTETTNGIGSHDIESHDSSSPLTAANRSTQADVLIDAMFADLLSDLHISSNCSVPGNNGLVFCTTNGIKASCEDQAATCPVFDSALKQEGKTAFNDLLRESNIVNKSTRADRLLVSTLFVRARAKVTRAILNPEQPLTEISMEGETWTKLVHDARMELDPFAHGLAPEETLGTSSPLDALESDSESEDDSGNDVSASASEGEPETNVNASTKPNNFNSCPGSQSDAAWLSSSTDSSMLMSRDSRDSYRMGHKETGWDERSSVIDDIIRSKIGTQFSETTDISQLLKQGVKQEGPVPHFPTPMSTLSSPIKTETGPGNDHSDECESCSLAYTFEFEDESCVKVDAKHLVPSTEVVSNRTSALVPLLAPTSNAKNLVPKGFSGLDRLVAQPIKLMIVKDDEDEEPPASFCQIHPSTASTQFTEAQSANHAGATGGSAASLLLGKRRPRPPAVLDPPSPVSPSWFVDLDQDEASQARSQCIPTNTSMSLKSYRPEQFEEDDVVLNMNIDTFLPSPSLASVPPSPQSSSQ